MVIVSANQGGLTLSREDYLGTNAARRSSARQDYVAARDALASS